VRRIQAIHLLVEFARLVSDHNANDDPMQHLVDALVAHAGADAVAVYLVSGDRLRLAASRALPGRLQSWIPEGEDSIGSELGRAALAALGKDDLTYAKPMPLVSSGGLFGAVLVFRKEASDESEPWQDELAQGLVDLVATALATSAHLESLVRANEELRQSRETLVRSERLRALGQMAAGVSHDLKNILSPLSLHLQLAERGNARGDTAAIDEGVREMKQILKRGLDVVERLRQFSRQTPGSKVAPVDLNALAREASELAKPRMTSGGGRLGRIHVDLGAPPQVLGEPSEIVSAVLNLLVNAIDATPSGGNVTLRTGEDAGGAWITVADDGPGMSLEVQARVFEPFFTTKGTEGTGLGLAMVYATVNRHRGQVRLETSPGKGATFTLWFPLPPPP
jgi:signal transduction histidine kinase